MALAAGLALAVRAVTFRAPETAFGQGSALRIGLEEYLPLPLGSTLTRAPSRRISYETTLEQARILLKD
jgi:hypothetical protein